MFEIGDKVKIKSGSINDFFNGEFDLLYGGLGEISEFKSKHVVSVVFKGIKSDGNDIIFVADVDDLELVEKEPDLKYKVGDKFEQVIQHEVVEVDYDMGLIPYRIVSEATCFSRLSRVSEKCLDGMKKIINLKLDELIQE